MAQTAPQSDLANRLKKEAAGIGLLYVEDNQGLRDNVDTLLTKFFPEHWSTSDAESAYELFQTHSPRIVLTDINLPGINGFELARRILAADSGVRIIVLSAFDEKEHLYEAINIGVFRYLPKPTKVPLLLDALDGAVTSIRNEQFKCIFDTQLRDIFNYQNNLLMMLEEETPILVNRQFLEFFGVKSLDGFKEEYPKLDKLLLEHKGFLFSTPESRWLEEATANPGKLYHVKMADRDNAMRHLILKLRTIPDKERLTILSLDDVTDLNLMALFDIDASKNDQLIQDRKAVLNLMKAVQSNNGEVKIHNLYRGLTLVAKGVLVDIEDDEVVLKTTYSQLKAVKLLKSMTISSELFPCSVLCKTVKGIDFDEQTVTFSEIRFVQESVDQRAFIRLEPDPERHNATLFYRDIKYFGETRIVDISIRSVKVEISALPAGMVVGDSIRVAFVLETDRQPLNLSVEGPIYRIDSLSKSYHIVLCFELSHTNEDRLMEYLSKRQLELIREFKGL